MTSSTAPAVLLSTTAKGQTLTATAGAATQLSDSFGGSTLIGASGDDTFNIVDPNTKIIAALGLGIDTVNAWCTFVLPANVDTLVLENGHTAGTGNNDGDLIVAMGAGDAIQGGLGADVLVDGGAGGDTFWFLSKGNHDLVYGFQTSGAQHDVMALANFAYTSLAQVEAHMTQVGADVQLALSNTDTILIRNTTIASFTAADFILPAAPTTPTPTPTPTVTVVAPLAVASGYLGFTGNAFLVPAAPTVNQATTAASTAAWHTYGVLWTAQTISYYVDGVEVASMATPSDMNTPMYMLVNLAIDGAWAGTVPATFTSAQMEIDYIRAYALNSSTAAAVASNTSYVLQSATDTAPANADIIQSAYTHSLVGSTAHTLELTGTANINATANNLGDTLIGNSGNNTLTGGTGNDTINAGAGNDILIGGGGADTFVFNQGSGHDVINDFSGHDVIDISSYLNAGLTPTLSDDASGNAWLTFASGTTIELLGVHSASLIATATGFTH